MEVKDGLLTPNCSSRRLPRCTPLPMISWGDPYEIWESMSAKDPRYKRDPDLHLRHPSITSRMRSVLLDWLSEVSELFKLHRETYYLAIDFVDRFLANQHNVPRARLQLIGITSLFIAAKMEEIYPPKLSDVAYVTDGACVIEDILNEELVIMSTLGWSLYPVTVIKWLSVFLQIHSLQDNQNHTNSSSKNGNANAKIKLETRTSGDAFLMPNYNSSLFAQIAHLADLCMLDVGCLTFDYDIIAASAFYHFTNEKVVFQCTKFNLTDIRDCVIWMTPFALAVRDAGFEEPRAKENNYWCNKQYHTADLVLLEKAHMKQHEMINDENEEAEGSSLATSENLPMPPSPVSSPSVSRATNGRRQSPRLSPSTSQSSSPGITRSTTHAATKSGPVKRKREPLLQIEPKRKKSSPSL